MLDAARTNVREPAGIFIKTATETLRGVVSFLNRDLPRALREVDDLSLLADLDDAATLARTSIERYVRDLEEEQGQGQGHVPDRQGETRAEVEAR